MRAIVPLSRQVQPDVTYLWAANPLGCKVFGLPIRWAANLRIGRDSKAAIEASCGYCDKSEFATPYLGLPILWAANLRIGSDCKAVIEASY
ncbi:MAG: hypothetical protein PHH43_06190 [Candidatus Cloacimonetes bacterium]|nr:hypothetical protein [Candidatus Cloacimonadota bacterium]